MMKMNMKTKTKTKKEYNGLYLVIDSDVLRTLSYLDMLRKTYGHIDMAQVNDEVLLNDFNYYSKILEHGKKEHIKFFIVEPVFYESQHSLSLLNFMKEYCYFPNPNAKDYAEKQRKARDLAYAYCSPYTFNGVTYDAPMKTVYNADCKRYTPVNDAYVMSNAAVEGCCVLTANKQDFIFNKKQPLGNKDRLDGICRINQLYGYCERNEKGVFTPKPITINLLMGKLKGDGKFGLLQQNGEKIKGSEFLR